MRRLDELHLERPFMGARMLLISLIEPALKLAAGMSAR
jgi:hypothetical protein